MKILLISNYCDSFGGISGQVRLLFENLKNEGEDVYVFSTRGSSLVRLWLFVKLLFVARRYKILHIHACSYLGFLPAVYGVLVGKLLKKHTVLTYHGGDGEKFFYTYPKLVHWFLIRTQINIVLSGFLAKVFEMHGLPCVIIPNILDDKVGESIFQRDIIKSNYISIRSLEPLYNIECIIKAFEIVKKQIPESKLAILGDGSCRERLEQYVKEHDIKDITFYGHIKNCDICYYLNQADIFLSTPTIDNQPMSILEAFRAGLLVISSHVGGVPYMIENGVTGLMFESGNYKELASLMISATNNQKDSLAIIENARMQLINYSWSHIRESLYKCYNYNGKN